MVKYFGNLISNWLLSLGVNDAVAQVITNYTALLLVFILAIIVFFIARKLLFHFVRIFVKRSKTNWDDILADKKVFNRLAYLAPAFVINILTPVVLPAYPQTAEFIQLVLNIYIIIIALLFFQALSQAYHA